MTGTSVTIGNGNAIDNGIRRGDILRYTTAEPHQRVTRVTPHILTVRPMHQWRWVEALHYAFERFVAWPMRDLLARVQS